MNQNNKPNKTTDLFFISCLLIILVIFIFQSFVFKRQQISQDF